MIKLMCLKDVHMGISLKGGKIYQATEGERGWFALTDETGEEYVYPPELFEVMERAADSPLAVAV